MALAGNRLLAITRFRAQIVSPASGSPLASASETPRACPSYKSQAQSAKGA
jgi:hypothetical protein